MSEAQQTIAARAPLTFAVVSTIATNKTSRKRVEAAAATAAAEAMANSADELSSSDEDDTSSADLKEEAGPSDGRKRRAPALGAPKILCHLGLMTSYSTIHSRKARAGQTEASTRRTLAPSLSVIYDILNKMRCAQQSTSTNHDEMRCGTAGSVVELVEVEEGSLHKAIRLMDVHSSAIPHEILTKIVQSIVEDSNYQITDMERRSDMDLPDDWSGEDGDLEDSARAIVLCPPAFIDTLGFRQACRSWREAAKDVKIKAFTVIVGCWCASAESALSQAKDIGAKSIIIDTRADRYSLIHENDEDRPDLVAAEAETMKRIFALSHQWQTVTLLLAYVPQLPPSLVPIPSNPVLSSLDISLRNSFSVRARWPDSVPLTALLRCMDLRAVQTFIIRKGGALGDSEEKLIDDAIGIFPSTTTFGLDVYRLRRHVLYPYFACSGFQTAKVWDREEDCLSPAEERAAIEVDTKMAQSLLRSSTLTTLDDTQDLSIKSCPSVLWPSLRRISAPLLTALHLYGPDVLSVRRLPPTASLVWVTHVPALRDLELHSVGLDERSLIQLLAGVAAVERLEITQHPCVQWTHNSNQSVVPGPPHHCHPIGAEVCASLAIGGLLPNAQFIRFGEGSWAEENLAELQNLVEARGQHLRSTGFGHSSAIRLRVSSSRCSRHQKEDRYIGIRDILGDEVPWLNQLPSMLYKARTLISLASVIWTQIQPIVQSELITVRERRTCKDDVDSVLRLVLGEAAGSRNVPPLDEHERALELSRPVNLFPLLELQISPESSSGRSKPEVPDRPRRASPLASSALRRVESRRADEGGGRWLQVKLWNEEKRRDHGDEERAGK
ncbi:hypothetical protein GGF50DRAFT_92843 [Schizophyllum commune]